MKNKPSDLDNQLKTHIIECISKIYWHYNNKFDYEDVHRAAIYHSKTKKGFKSLLNAVIKMSEKETDKNIVALRSKLIFFRSLYEI